jgi:hypothetical protein
VHSLYTSTAAPTSCFVRLHLRAHEFTLATYSPEPSTKYRFTFTTLFVYRLFQVAGWDRLHVLDEDEGRSDEEMVSRSFAVDALGMRGDRLRAMRLLLRYLVCHGTTPPTRDLMPDAVERRAREQLEREERVHEARVRRQLSLVVMVQSVVRRVLAIRHVQRVAQRSYTKALDPIGARLVYRHRRTRDVLTYVEKPYSLREKDVADPVDEWILSGETSLQTRYFNPLRGAFSCWNDVEAAVRLQRWFRRTMWTRGFPTWDLRCLTLAMVFHHHVEVPSDTKDRRHVEQITNYAYQRHVLHHDVGVKSHFELEGSTSLTCSCCSTRRRRRTTRRLAKFVLPIAREFCFSLVSHTLLLVRSSIRTTSQHSLASQYFSFTPVNTPSNRRGRVAWSFWIRRREPTRACPHR